MRSSFPITPRRRTFGGRRRRLFDGLRGVSASLVLAACTCGCGHARSPCPEVQTGAEALHRRPSSLASAPGTASSPCAVPGSVPSASLPDAGIARAESDGGVPAAAEDGGPARSFYIRIDAWVRDRGDRGGFRRVARVAEVRDMGQGISDTVELTHPMRVGSQPDWSCFLRSYPAPFGGNRFREVWCSDRSGASMRVLSEGCAAESINLFETGSNTRPPPVPLWTVELGCE